MKEPKIGEEYILIKHDLDLSSIVKVVVEYVDKRYFYTREGYKIRKSDFTLLQEIIRVTTKCLTKIGLMNFIIRQESYEQRRLRFA